MLWTIKKTRLLVRRWSSNDVIKDCSCSQIKFIYNVLIVRLGTLAFQLEAEGKMVDTI